MHLESCSFMHSVCNSVNNSNSEGSISGSSETGTSHQATMPPGKKSIETMSSQFSFLPHMEHFALNLMKMNEGNLKSLKDRNSSWPTMLSHNFSHKQFAVASNESGVLPNSEDEFKVERGCNKMESRSDSVRNITYLPKRSHIQENTERKCNKLFTTVPLPQGNKVDWNTLSQYNKTPPPFLSPPLAYPFSLHSPAIPINSTELKNKSFLFADQPAVFPPWWKFESIMLANHILTTQYFQALTRCNQLPASAANMPSNVKRYHTPKKQTFERNNVPLKTGEKTRSQSYPESTILPDVCVPSSHNINFGRSISEQTSCPRSSALTSNNGNLNFWPGNFPHERNVMQVQQGHKLSASNNKLEKRDHPSSNSVLTPPAENNNFLSPSFPFSQSFAIPEHCKASLEFQQGPASLQDFKVSINKSQPTNLNSFKEKRSHRCFYCGKLYSRKYGLKIHIRTHTGYKPLKCKICGRPFGDPSNLNKHVRLHAEGDTPYRCQLCGKVLVRRRDLERHINSRHPEKKTSFFIGDQLECPPADPRLWSVKQ